MAIVSTNKCFNRNNPRLGSSNIPFKRYMSSNYEDGIALPIDWDSDHRYNDFLLPLVCQRQHMQQRRVTVKPTCGKYTRISLYIYIYI